MIRGENLTLRRGSKILLEQADLLVHAGERIGIIGKNGAGKSSLFALLKGELDLDSGVLNLPSNWSISSVEQEIHDLSSSTLEFVLDGYTRLRQLEQEKQALLHDKSEQAIKTLTQIESQLDDMQAWQAPSQAEQLLSGLGFTPEQWHEPVQHFSGGWRMRLALARALMGHADLLLLDEPTNHLDMDAIIWLERWLSQYEGTVMIISHDSEFLNSCTRSILSFEQGKLYRYKGNFDAYLSQRAERLRQQEKALIAQNRQIEKLQQFISRFKAKASKAKQAQSRVKALERMEKLAPVYAESGLHIELTQPEYMPDPLIVIENLSIAYPNCQPLLKHINLMLRGAERIGILGVNGSGKSTFIKTLVGELMPIAGTIQPSKNVKIAYFAQHQLEQLDHEASPLQLMQKLAPEENEQTLRNYLGRFAFYGDMVTQAIAPLSGGEKARLALALMVWQKPNLLILDEPTNHLDMDTRNALTTALSEFEGATLIVSHDRNLLRHTVDKFWLVANQTIQAFDGDLEDYRQHINPKENTAEHHLKEPSIDRKTQKRQEAQERQRLSQLRKPILQEIEQLEKHMAELSQLLDILDAQIADPQLYEDTQRDKRLEIIQKHQQAHQKNQQYEQQWLALHEKLELIG